MSTTPSVKSQTSSSRNTARRPRSPPSMYHFDLVPPKAPKPLPKVEKRPKTASGSSPSKKDPSHRSPPSSFLGNPFSSFRGKRKVQAHDVTPVLDISNTSRSPLDASSLAFPSSSSLVSSPSTETPVSPTSNADPWLKYIDAHTTKPKRTQSVTARPTTASSTLKHITSITSLKAVLRPSTTHGSSKSDRPDTSGRSQLVPINTALPPPTPQLSPMTFSFPPSPTSPASPSSPDSPHPQLRLSQSRETSSVHDPDNGDPTTEPISPSIVPDLPKHSRAQSYSHSPTTAHFPVTLRDRPHTPFVENLRNVSDSPGLLAPPGPSPDGRGSSGVVRKEQRQGWSGEWNRDDMQDIIKKLRTLK